MPGFENTYLYNASVTPNFGASDVPSGVAKISATLDGTPIISGQSVTLATLGTNTFSLTAADQAGNTTTQTALFNVIYDFSGVLSPINPDGSSVFKLGSVVQVKFQLKDYMGSYISTATVRIYIAKVTDGVVGAELEATSRGSANKGNVARYDSKKNQYMFSLDTKNLSEGAWQIRIDLGDGTKRTVLITLKK